MEEKNRVNAKTQDNKNVNHNYPKLRFKEFTDGWVYDYLSNVSDVRDGTHDSPKYVSTGYPLITSKNLENNGTINFKNINYITLEDYKKINKRSNVDIGDILFGMIGTIGNPVIVNENNEFAIKNVALIKEEEKLKNRFLVNVLNSNTILKQFYKLNDGGTQKFIALGKIRKLKVPIPKIEEQNKIANFLSKIDQKIELLEQTLKLTYNQKIATQQILFSNSQKTKKMIISDILKESNIKTKDNINKRLTVKLNLKGVCKRESKDSEQEGLTNQYKRKTGQFIYGKQNLYKGALGIIPKELDGYISSKDIPSFDFINSDVNPQWFYYHISRKNYYMQLEKYSTGTGSKRISPKDFLKIKIDVPPLKKQEVIVSVLSNMDKKNLLMNQNLNYLKFYKRYLLQKMFI